jgi:hypothetical protein
MGKQFIAFASLFICMLSKGQDIPVRGTWVTNVASEALNSRENIKKAVDQSKAAGLNHLFVVVWNKGVTIYPSKVLQKYIGVKQDDHYPGRDPLQEMIEEAHKQGIKVHAWFEFGFSYGYKDTSSIWFKRYPEWLGRNNKGELLQKNGFYWWNALHPGPQRLMRELVLEVVKHYDIDGIQGDDRLPAMPAEGGFDAYTASLYKKDKQLALPLIIPRIQRLFNGKQTSSACFANRCMKPLSINGNHALFRGPRAFIPGQKNSTCRIGQPGLRVVMLTLSFPNSTGISWLIMKRFSKSFLLRFRQTC